MSGYFLRPKDTNRDRADNHLNAEQVGVVADYENEYLPADGSDFDPADDGKSGAFHFKDPKRREAEPGAPLPSTRNASYRGASPTGNRGRRGSVSRNVSSGFGKGTRAGRTGVRRG